MNTVNCDWIGWYKFSLVVQSWQIISALITKATKTGQIHMV